jgi:hypothetical protein
MKLNGLCKHCKKPMRNKNTRQLSHRSCGNRYRQEKWRKAAAAALRKVRGGKV